MAFQASWENEAPWLKNRPCLKKKKWMTWSFFGDRILRERTRRSDKKGIESKEDTKVWAGRACVSYILCQGSLLRSTASYMLFPGETWDRVSSYHTVGQSQQEANQITLHKGYLKNIIDQAHRSLRLITVALYTGKSWVLRIWNLSCPKAQAAGHYPLYKAYFWLLCLWYYIIYIILFLVFWGRDSQ